MLAAKESAAEEPRLSRKDSRAKSDGNSRYEKLAFQGRG
jgi:hypothetical protein